MKNHYIRVDSNSTKFYYADKEMTTLHREDGPTIECADKSLDSWYNNGIPLTQSEFHNHKIFANPATNPLYKAAVKEWENARYEVTKATNKEYIAWKEVTRLEKKYFQHLNVQ